MEQHGPVDFKDRFVSTGQLPSNDRVVELVRQAHHRFSQDHQGEVSQVYPALARVEPDLFGIAMVNDDGGVATVGDALHDFTIMSVSKPFIFAMVCDLIGPTGARERIGANATGHGFNSLAGIERQPTGQTNPMVNAGAIATTSLAHGTTDADKWRFLHEGLSRFAGRDLQLNDEVYASATETNFRNRSIAWMLESMGRLYCDPALAVDLYTRQCALNVNARDLAVMGATLADGGFNPVTREQVIKPETCHYVLAVMITAGLYETSGDWLYEIGLPGKSGIGGGIVTVSPGKGGLGVFAPRLDEAGNSVKGQLATQFLSQRLGLDLLISAPKRN
jgi:glutaminase